MDSFINSEFEQHCGDILIPLEKIDNKGRYRGIFKKYPYEVVFYKGNAVKGEVNNPGIEEEEFKNKIWLQNCGYSLRIIEKCKERSDNKGNYKWICQFLGCDDFITANKEDIKKGTVYNKQIDKDFIGNFYPQTEDILQVIELSDKKIHTTPLYKCKFINHPFIIYETKNHILRGHIGNPQIELDELIGKEFPQNCGDSLIVLEKTTKKDNNGSFLWKCEFQKYPNIVFVGKNQILTGTTENHYLPWRNKESLIRTILENFNEKPTLEELAKYFGLSKSHIGLKIREFSLDNYIKYDFGNLQNNIVEFIKSIYFGKLLINKEILKNKEIDIYFPDLKLGLEINGNYWHSELYLKQTYHQEKSLLANNEGIILIHIWEWEWNEKQGIIKSLIKSKLGIFDKIIGARNCNIKNLSNKEYQEFCDENHLQGKCGARVKLGLFYKNELIQVMSFGSPRFTLDFEWEILRECSKLGYCVVGGKEKLWKYFIRNYHPNSVISYCDFSKFTGESYLKLGFKKERLNKPGFVWWDSKKNKTYWRNPYKNQEMAQIGYLKLFDAGQLVFIWSK